MAIEVGTRVRFSRAGRFPKPEQGIVIELDPGRPETGWADVECDGPDGPILRKVRPKSMTPI